MNKKDINSTSLTLLEKIFKYIKRKNYIYLIERNSHSWTASFYNVKGELVEHENDITWEVFDLFRDEIGNDLQTGMYAIYPNEDDTLGLKYVRYYNPTISDHDLYELIIYQEFGFKPSEIERQEILKKTIKKEKIKQTLAYACYENNTPKIAELAKSVKATELDKPLAYNGTPLYLCIERNNFEGFKALAQAGANMTKKSMGTSPLELAFDYSSEMVKYIYENYKDVFKKEVEKKGFYLLKNSTDLSLFDLVKEQGADLNHYDKNFPHLHNFTDRNNLVGIKYCLDNGMDINEKDKQGRTALAKAILRGHKEAIEFLKTHGAVEA